MATSDFGILQETTRIKESTLVSLQAACIQVDQKRTFGDKEEMLLNDGVLVELQKAYMERNDGVTGCKRPTQQTSSVFAFTGTVSQTAKTTKTH
jgi:hypothetical protein